MTALRPARYVAVLLFGLAAGGARLWAATDDEVIARMKQRVQALNAQIIATQDPFERVKLQEQLVKIGDDALRELSPKTRPLVAVSLKIVQPMQELVAHYMTQAAEFTSSPSADFRTIKSREDIKARAQEIEKLATLNQEVLARMNNLESDIEKSLVADGVAEADRQGFMTGFRNSALRRMGPLRAIRNLDTKLFVQWQAAFALLDAQWGKWHTAGDAPLVWDDAASREKFVAIATEMKSIGDRQTAAEQALATR